MNRGLGSRRRASRQELADSIGQKFRAWKTDLQKEFMLDKMTALSSERRKYVEQFIERKLKDPEVPKKEKRGWAMWKAMHEAEGLEQQADTNLVKGFTAWLMGRGSDCDHQKTPWGREPHAMELPEARAFIDGFVDALMESEKYLLKLIWKTPQTLEEWFIYYKYVLNADTYIKYDDPWFFLDFKELARLPMSEAWKGERKLEDIGLDKVVMGLPPGPQLNSLDQWTGPQITEPSNLDAQEMVLPLFQNSRQERARALGDLYRKAYGSKELAEEEKKEAQREEREKEFKKQEVLAKEDSGVERVEKLEELEEQRETENAEESRLAQNAAKLDKMVDLLQQLVDRRKPAEEPSKPFTKMPAEQYQVAVEPKAFEQELEQDIQPSEYQAQKWAYLMNAAKRQKRVAKLEVEIQELKEKLKTATKLTEQQRANIQRKIKTNKEKKKRALKAKEEFIEQAGTYEMLQQGEVSSQ